MTTGLLSFYHKLPYPLKVLAASARGYALRFQRYDRETEQLVEAAQDREGWSTEQWKRWQEEKLAFVLQRAAKQVPYYREIWAKRRMVGDRSSIEQLENWPVLNKEMVRQNPRAFIAEDCDVKNMIHDHTSGTTGKPLDIWVSVPHNKEAYAIFEARCKRWYSINYHDRWGMIGGQLVTAVERRQPPFWVWNQGLKQLYMSSYHLAPDLIPAYLEAMQRHRITYIYGYSSSLYELAYGANEKGVKLNLRVAIADAEPLLDYQREAISKAFSCPTRVTYGCTEMVISAQECEHGSLHLWPELGVLEVLDWKNEAKLSAEETGRFICTGLLNADMPLIRYDLGDTGSLASASEVCTCGRGLPKLCKLEGRMDDLLYTRDGRRIGRLDPAFKVGLNIKEAQIIQEDLDQILIKFVPAIGYGKADEQTLEKSLKLRLGDVNIRFEAVSAIPREENGKFRAVVGMKKGEKTPI